MGYVAQLEPSWASGAAWRIFVGARDQKLGFPASRGLVHHSRPDLGGNFPHIPLPEARDYRCSIVGGIRRRHGSRAADSGDCGSSGPTAFWRRSAADIRLGRGGWHRCCHRDRRGGPVDACRFGRPAPSSCPKSRLDHIRISNVDGGRGRVIPQFGKLVSTDSANGDERERQVDDSADLGDHPQRMRMCHKCAVALALMSTDCARD